MNDDTSPLVIQYGKRPATLIPAIFLGFLFFIFVLLLTILCLVLFYFLWPKVPFHSPLLVSPNFIVSNELVTINWESVPDRLENDWIGVFPSSNVIDAWPIARFMANVSISATIRLFNLRNDYEIRYFHGKSNERIITKISVDADFPLQGRLAITKNPTEMRVMWSSNTSATPIVLYKKVDEVLYRPTTGISSSYGKKDMCHEPATEDYHPRDGTAFWHPGYQHDVLLTNLQPATRYYYQFGTPGKFSERSYFDTPPLVGSKQDLNMIVFGDLGSFPLGYHPYRSPPGTVKTFHSLYSDVDKNDYNLVIHNGDIAYAYGCGLGWEWFGHNIEPIAKRTSYMVSVGNHEYQYRGSPFQTNWTNYVDDDSGGECNVPFMKRFNMPHDKDDEKNIWFDFAYGSIHFVFLSFEHDFRQGSIQWKWLEKTLKNVNRVLTPYVVVVSHRPMYCSGNFSDDYRMTQHIQLEIEDLFYIYHVDLFFGGHYHSYERSCPVFKQKCNVDGTIHVLSGSAGYLDTKPWMVPQPSWSTIRFQKTGYNRMRLKNNVLYVDFIESGTGNVLDSFNITRNM